MVVRSIFRPYLPHILLFLIFIAAPGPLWAGGQAEQDPLAEARAAYEDQNYNLAISLTAQVMKDYPDRFDEAQSLINAIRAAKNRYNRTFEELVQLYQNALEQQNDAGLSESYTIIKDLERMDPYPNADTQEGLVRAREATGSVYNRIRHANLMDRALAQLQQKDFSGAVETYLSGYDLALDIFQTKQYAAEAMAEATQLRSRSSQLGNAFLENLPSTEAASAFLSEFSAATPIETLQEWINGFESGYRELSQLRWNVQNTVRALEVLRLLILNEYAEPGEDEIYHLAYLIILNRGRSTVESESGVDEGILGAIDTRWDSGASAVLSTLSDTVYSLYGEAADLFRQGEYNASIETFTRMSNFARELNRASLVWQSQIAPSPGEREPLPDYQALADAPGAPAYIGFYRDTQLFAEQMAMFGGEAIELARLGAGMKSQGEAVAANEAISMEDISAARLTLNAQEAEISRLRNTINSRSIEYPGNQELQADSMLVTAEQDERMTQVENLFTSSNEDFLLIYLRIAEEPLDRKLAEFARAEAEGNSALSGTPISFQGDTFNARYPTRSTEIFTALRDDARSVLSLNESLLTELGGLPEWLQTQEDVSTRLSAIRQRSGLLRAHMDRASLRINEAADLIRLARQNRLDGERRYNEARQRMESRQFNVNNPNAIENTVGEARDFFLEALKSEYDPLLDRRTDSIASNSDRYDIQSLLSELAQAKRDYFLPQREASIAEARRLIRQQAFEDASRMLDRAEDYHRQLDSADNPEIVRLKEFVDRAINTSSAWYIAKTDPLYAEMSQLINLAREDYLTAEQRVNKGQTFGVEGLLSNSEEKLSAVQNTFPQNLEVGILLLKIELMRTDNSNARTTILSEKFQQARTAFNAEEYQKSLSLAKALQAINPSYPGLNDLIFEAEIATGQRVREPDPADIRAAENLYAEANSIWQNRIQDQYASALQTLQQAIARYTPFNPPSKYLTLKQQLEIRVDTSAATILSAADQLQYQSALESYQQGNFVQAKLIVDQLIQKGDNDRNPKLLDLQQRINSRL